MTPEQIAKFKLFNGGNPLYPNASPSQAGSAPWAPPTPADPSAQPQPDSQFSPAQKSASLLYGSGNGSDNPLYAETPDSAKLTPSSPTPAPVQRGSIATGMFGAQPPTSSPSLPLTTDQFAQQNPDAYKAYMPARPRSDFDPDTPHPQPRHALAALFAGMAEYGRPGQGAAMVNRWNDQYDAERNYDANEGKLKSGAIAQAFHQSLQQQSEQAGTAHTIQDTENLKQNSPAMARKAQFLSTLQSDAESGKYDAQSLRARALRMADFNHINVMPDEIDSLIQGTKPVGPKFDVKTDSQGRFDYSTDRQGNRYVQSDIVDQKGSPKPGADPDLLKQYQSIEASHQQARGEKLADEKTVAGYAAERQGAGFQQAQTMEGRKTAQPHLETINDAQRQQEMMGQLLSGKVNPFSQTAAMFKMIGLEQPTGSHRVLPAEVEGVEQAGGLSDRLKQKLLNWKEGDRFSPDLVPDLVATAKVLTQNKIKTANDNLQSTYRNTGYKVPGSDTNGRLDKPGDYQQQGSGAGQGGGQVKTATQQHVADYAKAKGITPQQATQEFQQAGYTIQ